MAWLFDPWPWWLSGILIGLTVPLLYLLAGKQFGISSTFRHIGAICTPNAPMSYLRDHNWRRSAWQLFFVLGIAGGGFIANHLLSTHPIRFLPDTFSTPGGLVRLFIGGVMVGFGARYAGGCTSGHSITGIANLNVPSLIATIAFFAGGFFMTWVLGGLLLPN